MTFSEYFNYWLNGKKNTLEQSTYEAYTVYVYRHIIPYFESLKFEPLELDEVTPKHIYDYMHYLLREGRIDGNGGLSLVSVKKHISIIKQAFNEAVLLELLNSNPAISIHSPRIDVISDRSVFMTSVDAQCLIDSLRGNSLFPLVVTALYYGLRRSEVLGLKWSAIDFYENTISIKCTVVKNLTIVEKNRCKTQLSNCTFELLPEISELLNLCRQNQIKDNTYDKNGYVFLKDNGEVYRPDSLTRTFQRFLKRNGFSPMRFHDLRHSTASILFDRGWSERDVQEWLRHSDIETTMNIYVHYGKNRKILKGKELEGMFVF